MAHVASAPPSGHLPDRARNRGTPTRRGGASPCRPRFLPGWGSRPDGCSFPEQRPVPLRVKALAASVNGCADWGGAKPFPVVGPTAGAVGWVSNPPPRGSTPTSAVQEVTEPPFRAIHNGPRFGVVPTGLPQPLPNQAVQARPPSPAALRRTPILRSAGRGERSTPPALLRLAGGTVASGSTGDGPNRPAALTSGR